MDIVLAYDFEQFGDVNVKKVLYLCPNYILDFSYLFYLITLFVGDT